MGAYKEKTDCSGLGEKKMRRKITKKKEEEQKNEK